MTRLSRDREAEIREWHKKFNEQHKSHPFIGEILSEIAALRGENERLQKSIAKQIARIDQLEAAWR